MSIIYLLIPIIRDQNQLNLFQTITVKINYSLCHPKFKDDYHELKNTYLIRKQTSTIGVIGNSSYFGQFVILFL